MSLTTDVKKWYKKPIVKKLIGHGKRKGNTLKDWFKREIRK